MYIVLFDMHLYLLSNSSHFLSSSDSNSYIIRIIMMTSSNGNIFGVTGLLCGELTGPRWIPHTEASDAAFWCCLKKRLSKQSRRWWFETPSHSLWRHCNGVSIITIRLSVEHMLLQFPIVKLCSPSKYCIRLREYICVCKIGVTASCSDVSPVDTSSVWIDVDQLCDDLVWDVNVYIY